MAKTKKEYVEAVVQQLISSGKPVLLTHKLSPLNIKLILTRPDVLAKLSLIAVRMKMYVKGYKALKSTKNFKIGAFKFSKEFMEKSPLFIEEVKKTCTNSQDFTIDNNVCVIRMHQDSATGDLVNDMANLKSDTCTYADAVRDVKLFPKARYIVVVFDESIFKHKDIKFAEVKFKLNDRKIKRRTPAKIRQELVSKTKKKIALLNAKIKEANTSKQSIQQQLNTFQDIKKSISVEYKNMNLQGVKQTNPTKIVNEWGQEYTIDQYKTLLNDKKSEIFAKGHINPSDFNDTPKSFKSKGTIMSLKNVVSDDIKHAQYTGVTIEPNRYVATDIFNIVFVPRPKNDNLETGKVFDIKNSQKTKTIQYVQTDKTFNTYDKILNNLVPISDFVDFMDFYKFVYNTDKYQIGSKYQKTIKIKSSDFEHTFNTPNLLKVLVVFAKFGAKKIKFFKMLETSDEFVYLKTDIENLEGTSLYKPKELDKNLQLLTVEPYNIEKKQQTITTIDKESKIKQLEKNLVVLQKKISRVSQQKNPKRYSELSYKIRKSKELIYQLKNINNIQEVNNKIQDIKSKKFNNDKAFEDIITRRNKLTNMLQNLSKSNPVKQKVTLTDAQKLEKHFKRLQTLKKQYQNAIGEKKEKIRKNMELVQAKIKALGQPEQLKTLNKNQQVLTNDNNQLLKEYYQKLKKLQDAYKWEFSYEKKEKIRGFIIEVRNRIKELGGNIDQYQNAKQMVNVQQLQKNTNTYQNVTRLTLRPDLKEAYDKKFKTLKELSAKIKDTLITNPNYFKDLDTEKPYTDAIYIEKNHNYNISEQEDRNTNSDVYTQVAHKLISKIGVDNFKELCEKDSKTFVDEMGKKLYAEAFRIGSIYKRFDDRFIGVVMEKLGGKRAGQFNIHAVVRIKDEKIFEQIEVYQNVRGLQKIVKEAITTYLKDSYSLPISVMLEKIYDLEGEKSVFLKNFVAKRENLDTVKPEQTIDTLQSLQNQSSANTPSFNPQDFTANGSVYDAIKDII